MKQSKIKVGKFYEGKSGNVRFVNGESRVWISYYSIVPCVGSMRVIKKKSFARWATTEVEPVFFKEKHR